MNVDERSREGRHIVRREAGATASTGRAPPEDLLDPIVPTGTKRTRRAT